MTHAWLLSWGKLHHSGCLELSCRLKQMDEFWVNATFFFLPGCSISWIQGAGPCALWPSSRQSSWTSWWYSVMSRSLSYECIKVFGVRCAVTQSTSGKKKCDRSPLEVFKRARYSVTRLLIYSPGFRFWLPPIQHGWMWTLASLDESAAVVWSCVNSHNPDDLVNYKN